jgi:hypothetical protein
MGLCRKKRVLRLLHIKPQQILFSEPPLVTYGRTDGQTGVFLQLFAANTSKCLAGKLIGVFKGGSTAIIKECGNKVFDKNQELNGTDSSKS